MPISVASRDSSFRLTAAFKSALAGVAREAFAVEGCRAGEVSIVLARDPELRELNKRWRKIDRATDVLSFPYAYERMRIDGDLILSLDRLLAQAKRYRVSPGQELMRLVVHGALHLCGHDHHAVGERLEMRKAEATARKACVGKVAALDRVLKGLS